MLRSTSLHVFFFFLKTEVEESKAMIVFVYKLIFKCIIFSLVLNWALMWTRGYKKIHKIAQSKNQLFF